MKHPERTIWFLAVIAAVACVFSAPALAAEPGNGDDGIPAYAISRLKVLAGTAWVRTADGGDWEEATTNTPLTPNSRVSVPDGSEAELQFHGGQFVLLTSGTDVEVQEMADDKTRFRLRSGEIRFDLPGDDFAPVSVRVPGGAAAGFAEPGRYWLTVTDEDTTRLVVRRGKATVTQDGEKHRVDAGQQAAIGRTITVGRHQGPADVERPMETYTVEEQKAGVPPVVTNELREYGDWVYVQQYGYVWRPSVAGDWSPHYYGRWTWVAPYGWNWVSYEPWGWYPYRSGYWVNDLSFGWVWTPYNSWISVGFVWRSYDYYHYNPYYYHRNYRYYGSNARFVPEGRNVRWEPMRPGERYRQPEYRRTDARMGQWNRPLDANRVFVAPRPAASGRAAQQRQWRDVNTVRTERQNAIRTAPAPSGATQKGSRTVRPEMAPRAPSGAQRGAVAPATKPETQTGREIQRGGSGTAPRMETPTAPRAPSTAPQPTAPRGSAPTPQYYPSRDYAPAPQTTTPRESAPAPRSSPSRESAPAPQTSPSRESAPSRDTGGGGDRGWGVGGSGGGSRGGGSR
jgi:hypothetical protein